MHSTRDSSTAPRAFAAASIARDLRRALPPGSARLLTPSDPGYEEARLVYNRMHDLRPAAIVQTLQLDALAAALQVARTRELPLAIRGGGHHIAGFGSCEGGIVLDFSRFRGVRLHRATGVVEVEPGARLADVDRVLCAEQRVIPLGTVSDTGVAGLALGGGIGWLLGVYGLTCDHLVGADVLLADGRSVRAEDHPDLLWALRGGGGGFGVVTRFRFQTRALPPLAVGSGRIALEHAAPALLRLAEFLASSCPPELTVAPMLGPLTSGAALSIDFCICAPDPAMTVAVFETLRGAVAVGAWKLERAADFCSWQRALDGAFLPPMRGYWKSQYTEAFPGDHVDALVAAVKAQPPDRGAVLIEHLHGAFAQGDDSTSAFPLRGARFGILVSARWSAPSQDAAHVAWVRALHDRLDPRGQTGSYSNYTPADDPRGGATYRGAIAARLARVKAALDPHHLFRRNHGVAPADRAEPVCPSATAAASSHGG